LSALFKNPPGTFAEYENPNSPAANPLRDDHLVLLTINRLLALHAAFKRWHKRRKTLRALADLDERQLRDIGLTRDQVHYEPLAELEDTHSKRTNKALGGRNEVTVRALARAEATIMNAEPFFHV
jgi:uncharacterized protein YjiS (DUF1127 family)